MLDIRFIRENKDLVAEKSKQKGYDVDVNKLLEVDEDRKTLIGQVEALRTRRNEISDSMKCGKPEQAMVDEGKRIKVELAEREDLLAKTEAEFNKLIKVIPNMPSDDVPIGASEADNVVSKEWGEKPKFDFEPKSHWQIAEIRDLIDKERAAKVAGARFAYIKGDLVKLQLALMNFVIDTLTDESKIQEIISSNNLQLNPKPFIPILPPALIKTEVYEAMDRLDPRDDRYKIEDEELWLQGSAEHTIGSMYIDEILPAEQLPIRYIGYLTSFRKEAGTYGKDNEGIIRMHQFDKLEMESFTKPEDGMNEHLLLVAIQEYLVQQLGLPYRVLTKCSADIGKPNARGIDIEVWMPGQNAYRETHTADYMTDYQARRLGTRIKTEAGTEFIHTNDATALALGRTLVAIIENYQTADGQIKVPDALKNYMGGKEVI
jgi:seryl-tRNA synthetase